MRTVTFSTPEVQNAIANNFIALNSNIEGDPLAGESIGHAPDEEPGTCIRGNGRQNVQTIFMTPNEEIFHVATGYVSPEEMLEEMTFAVKLFVELQREQDNRYDLVRIAHQERPGMPRRNGMGNMTGQSIKDLEESVRNGRPPGDMFGGANPMQAFSDQFVQQDQQYMVNHPLISRQDFERDPGELVGRGKTFFSSSKNSNGSVPQVFRSGRR